MPAQSDLSRAKLEIRQELKPADLLRVSLHGDLTVRQGSSPFFRLEKIVRETTASTLILDVSGLHAMDSLGMALVGSVRASCEDRGRTFRLEGATPQVTGVLNRLDVGTLLRPEVPPAKPRWMKSKVEGLGSNTLEFIDHMRSLLIFVGDVSLALLSALHKPGGIRYRHVFKCIEVSGVNALPIISLINLLVGIVLAFQAAIQLRQFGANIFVADLVGIAQTREFGPMITAILLAGRSGSAFAAEISSMKLNEEVDALTTMGFDPVEFLVLPRVLALLVCLPLLTLYADVVGILGGLIVGVTGLDLTVQGYLLETQKAVTLFDVFSGITKTLAFALIISGIGCLRGFQARGGSDSVGAAATSAVVSGIFLIILTDAAFTVMFQYV